jgi:signal transduction histidine kinase
MASLGTLVSGVAHEVNNPNTSILMNASILNKTWKHILPILDQHAESCETFAVGGMDYADFRERIPRLLNDIEENAGRIRDIVGDLKTFARQSPPELTDTVDINLALQKAQGLTANLIKKSTRHFTVNAGNGIPRFYGNRRKVEQVLINLLINACQSLTASSQSIEVYTRFEPVVREVVVEVRDRGRGIPAELLDRIKDPFFTTKQNSSSTGLGLAISDKIMKDHGGRMRFTSAPDTGTIVTLRFPVKQQYQ